MWDRIGGRGGGGRGSGGKKGGVFSLVFLCSSFPSFLPHTNELVIRKKKTLLRAARGRGRGERRSLSREKQEVVGNRETKPPAGRALS